MVSAMISNIIGPFNGIDVSILLVVLDFLIDPCNQPSLLSVSGCYRDPVLSLTESCVVIF